jgi:hypothetical protein
VPHNPYRVYRFPKEIIPSGCACTLALAVSLREVELTMAYQGIPLEVSELSSTLSIRRHSKQLDISRKAEGEGL